MDPVSPDDGDFWLHHQPPRFNQHDPEDKAASSAAVALVQINRGSNKNNSDISGNGKGGGLKDKDDTEGARAKKQPRGRPTGSKDKNKNFQISGSNSATSSIHAIEVADGHDILEDISNFARRLNRGLCILSGNGFVSNVTIHQPAMSSGALMTLHGGLFEIVSLSGYFMPPPAPPASSWLTIYLGGSLGQVVGGSVVGRLVASGTVVIVAMSFSDLTYERLSVPVQEEKTGGMLSQEVYRGFPSVRGGGHTPFRFQQPPQ